MIQPSQRTSISTTFRAWPSALGEPAPDPRRMQSEVRTAASPIVTYFKEPPIDLDDDRPRRKPATVDVGAPGAAPRCGGLGVAQADGAALHHATPRCAEDHPTYFAPPCRAQGRAMRQCLKSPRSVRLPPPRRGKKYPAVRYCTANTVPIQFELVINLTTARELRIATRSRCLTPAVGAAAESI